jgi:dTDP-4-dehydrorhamnose reductase
MLKNVILVTGANGLLGKYVVDALAESNYYFLSFNKDELDITNLESLKTVIEKLSPTYIINCAAYTNVAKAEQEKELCYQVNVDGVKNLVSVSNLVHAKLIQISTDYVFDGNSDIGLYYPNSKKNPLNYYGLTKHLAEDFITSQCNNYSIIRTSWLYGDSSNNFVSKILDFSKSQDSIEVVDDEFGSPTYALDLAYAIIKLINKDIVKVIHLTNVGFISRYDFARKIIELDGGNIKLYRTRSLSKGVLRPKRVNLVNLEEINSLSLRPWLAALSEFISTKK